MIRKAVLTMKTFFISLDAFRGIISIFVVIFHLRITDTFLTGWQFINSVPFYLMIFFFTLSGFIITFKYGDKFQLKFSVFMKARFVRIFPLHLFMFLLIIIGELIKLLLSNYNIVKFNNLPFTGSLAPKEIIPNLLLLQAWLPFADTYSINYTSWFISVEFYLYAIFYIITIQLQRFRLYILTACTLILSGFFFTQADTDSWYYAIEFGTLYFFYGILLFKVYTRIIKIKLGYLPASIIEIVCTITLYMLLNSANFPGKPLLTSVMFLIFILTFAFDAGIISQLLNNPLMHFLSKISYSVFLTHTLIINIFVLAFIFIQKYTGLNCTVMIGKERYLTTGNVSGNNLLLLGIIISVILLASLTNKHIEQKWRKH